MSDQEAKEKARLANREACRRYRAKNREKLNEKARARTAANPEKTRETTRKSMKKAYAKDPEKYKARSTAWRKQAYAERPELFAAWREKRRVRKMAPAWADDFMILEMYDLARRRTESTGIVWEVDHIVPLQSRLVCGLHIEHNLRVVPRKVNREKGNLMWPDHPNPSKAISLPETFY